MSKTLQTAKDFLEDYSIGDINIYNRQDEHFFLYDLLEEYAKISSTPTTQNGWISVEDRLPEYGIAVLLIISNGAMTIGYLKSATKTSRYRQWQLFGDMEDTLCVQEHDQVTHWQPLPLKPQP
jgi:hypothetical protein